jgi:serine/threonine-protein kinase
VDWVPKVSTRFGQYEIQALIGHGGMSVVYRAEHVALGRKVALKILSPALTDDEDFQERFTRESRLAAALDHPNIVPIYEAGNEAGAFFIAMRYVDGSDLKQLIQREGPLDPARTSSIIKQVASALSAAHDENLVHRDVKPANILISSRRREDDGDHVYLSDFGIAKHAASRVNLTKTGLFVGTAEYAAPEQIEGHQLDGRSDIYALGCVLYECLTGEMPYQRESEVAMMYAHLLEPPPRVSDKRPDLSPELDEVVAKAMAKSKDDRYDNVRDFAAAASAELAKTPAVPVPPLAAAGDGATNGPPTAGETVIAAPGGDGRETVLASPPTSIAEQQRSKGDGKPGFVARNRQWLIPVVIAALAAAVAAVGVLLFTGGDDGTPSGAAQPPPAAQPPAAAGDITQLASLVPTPVWKDCAVKSVPATGATQSAVCLGLNGPDELELSIYPSAAALEAAYEQARKGANVGKDFGGCSGTVWGGEGAWLHGPDKPGGKDFCYFDGNDAVIVWTHEKLGQDTHTDMLGTASVGSSDHAGLFRWWRFWHHQMGKLVEQ